MITIELKRVYSIAKKELIQIKRDAGTFTFLFLIPVFQVLLFGLAINTNPKHLPTAVISSEDSSFTRTLLQGFKHTDYFLITSYAQNEEKAAQLLESGSGLFVINIPPHFSRNLIRGQKPHIMIEADASDPVAVVNAFRAAAELPDRVFQQELKGSLSYLSQQKTPFNFDIHPLFNPESISQYNIVPGLISLLLFTTLSILTSFSIAQEYEEGTFESLLTTPLNPIDIILGKVIPHFLVAYMILLILLIISYFIFSVPFYGSLPLFLLIAAPYNISSLAMGITVSAIAKTKFQAVASINAYILVTIVISGFLFPFKGMPIWAQYFGELIPLTHFLRITRNIMLKGAEFHVLWPDIWPILIFMILIIISGVVLFKKTLD